MKGYWPIFKRELFAFFVTPLAWVLIFVFLVVQGMHFYLVVDHFSTTVEPLADQTPLQAFFGNTMLLYLVLFLLVPAMTMRLLAEERRTGTLESLLTAPVAPWAVVLAKYTASLVTYVFMWLPTVLYVIILKQTGTMDLHTVATSYGGVFLVGAGYLSVGLLMSALTQSQFLALILSALVLLVFFILGVGEFVAKPGSWMQELCSYVSVWTHMNEWSTGLVDSRRLVFNGTLILLPLFLATRALEARKWGGS